MDLLPYIKLKSEQAKPAMRFTENKKASARGKRLGRGGSSPLTQEELRFREELRVKVGLMNANGKFARAHGGGLNWSLKSMSMA